MYKLTAGKLVEQLQRVNPEMPVYVLVDCAPPIGDSAMPSIAVVTAPDKFAYAQLCRARPLEEEPTPNDPDLYRDDGDEIAVVFTTDCPACLHEMGISGRPIPKGASTDRYNLVSGISREVERCVRLKAEYDKIPGGQFGSMMIQQTIDEAHHALAENNIAQMVTALKGLQECE